MSKKCCTQTSQTKTTHCDTHAQNSPHTHTFDGTDHPSESLEILVGAHPVEVGVVRVGIADGRAPTMVRNRLHGGGKRRYTDT